jgi:WD40 repeat protein
VWTDTTNATFATEAEILSVAFSLDGDSVITGDVAKAVTVRDIKSGRVVRTMSEEADGFVYAVAALPDGKTIVSTDAYGRVQLWDLASGDLIRTFKGPETFATAVAVAPDGNTFVVGDDSGTISVYNCKASGEWPAQLCQREAASYAGRGGS